MATNLTVTSQYKGNFAGEIFVEAFKKSDTIEKGLITVLPNIIGSGNMPQLSYSAELQPYACGWNPDGDVTYNEKNVTLTKFMVSHELCKEDFASTFAAQAAGLFSAKAEVPQDVQSAILNDIVMNLGARIDEFIWQGNTAASVSGLTASLVADTDTIGVYTEALTKTNVVDALEAVYDAIPEAIVESDDLVIAVSPKVLRLYRQNLAAQGDNTTVSSRELDYLGVRLESVGALSGDKIYAYRVPNVAFMTGLEADLNRVDVKDMDDTDLSGQIRTKAVLAIAADYSFANEIVVFDNAFNQ
jgi:hypothetical protein